MADSEAGRWPGIVDHMTVDEVRIELGMTSKDLNDWWTRGAGPYRERDGVGDSAVRYERGQVEEVRRGMRLLGTYGLEVKNARPLGFRKQPHEDPETLGAGDVKKLLGVSQTVLHRWRIDMRGPLPKGASNTPSTATLWKVDYDRLKAAGISSFWCFNYNSTGTGYVRTKRPGLGRLQVARLVLEEDEGGVQVRYVNEDRLDLRRSNLYVEFSPYASARTKDQLIAAAKRNG